MKAKSVSENKIGLELKYCERCGGLWLRPMGGSQIYCSACGRAMAELPPASWETGRARVPRGPRRIKGDGGVEGPDGVEGFDVDEAGGVA